MVEMDRGYNIEKKPDRPLSSMRRLIGAALIGASLVSLVCLVPAAREKEGRTLVFEPSSQCMACHNGLVTASGRDVSIGVDWRASMMANSSRDLYWQAGIRRETIDHPMASMAIQDECSKCHMPMARFEAHEAGTKGVVFEYLPFVDIKKKSRSAALSEDGVSCAMCHQIEGDNLGKKESFVGGFNVKRQKPDEPRIAYGPYDIDKDMQPIMRSATGYRPVRSDHIEDSGLCATCHTLYTHSLNKKGEIVGELPEQVPYLEWLHSDYAQGMSCQSCHMPVVEEKTPIANLLADPREELARHVFRGGNFFMLKLLNANRKALGVRALSSELSISAMRTTEHLKTGAAQVGIETSFPDRATLRAEVTVENLSGHKLPTAYPSRRVWIHFVVRNKNRKIVFESGAMNDNGSIQGNDNDEDPTRYEPHYCEITSNKQVQIYESIMANPKGDVTTGLLEATRFIKDNRILPSGFDKQQADDDVAVHGQAKKDEAFQGGRHTTTYKIDVADHEGPFELTAQILYQPIGFRWARNLADYDAAEPKIFVDLHRKMASNSAMDLARKKIKVGRPVSFAPDAGTASP